MALLAFFAFMMKRNNDVYNYRSKILDFIHNEYRSVLYKDNLTESELNKATKLYEERHNEFDKVSYDYMVYRFWQKLDSFYNNNIIP